MIGGVGAVDVGMLAAAGAVALFAVVYAMMRGGRGDPLERIAAWATTHGLEYVAPESDRDVARFVGEIDGSRIEVLVVRVARGLGNDLPTRLTTVTVAPVIDTGAAAEGAEGAGGAPVCVLQPAEWVVDRDGRALGEPVPSGDATFDAVWSARGIDSDSVRRVLSPRARSRLLEADAEGLIIEVANGSVSIPMPGVGADVGELDGRLAVARGLSQLLGEPGSIGEE